MPKEQMQPITYGADQMAGMKQHLAGLSLEDLEEFKKDMLRFKDTEDSQMSVQERREELELLKTEEELLRKKREALESGDSARILAIQEEIDALGETMREEIAEHEAKKERYSYYAMPQFYNEQQHLRAGWQEAIKEVGGQEWQVHIQNFENALNRKDEIQCAAILHQLCDQYNENEILNYYGLPSGIDGMRRFYKEILMGKLHMSEQVALLLVCDLSYLCEKRNHLECARLVEKTPDGRFRFLTNEEHTEAIWAETKKRTPRDLTKNLNRLAYGQEIPRPPYGIGAERDFFIGELGLRICVMLGKRKLELEKRLGEDMLENTAINLAKPWNMKILKERFAAEGMAESGKWFLTRIQELGKEGGKGKKAETPPMDSPVNITDDDDWLAD